MPVDLRFYTKLDAYNLGQLVALCGGELVKGDAAACPASPASASNAGSDEICFFEGRAKDIAAISDTAGFCIVKDNLVEKLADREMALITHPNPRWAHVVVCKALFKKKDWREEGTATLDATAHIHPTANISAGAQIGANTIIGPNVYVGPGVIIGADCQIEANVSIECAIIGQGVTLSPGVRIGQAGFGVLLGPDGPEDIPHWGRVIMGDHVSIGAASCVDRGAFDDTIIGARTKIDNMCQVAHNVVMGRNVLMASYAGISGSSTIGDNVIMGGGVGIADHLTIGNDVTILARSGLMHNVPDGERWGGYPAKPWRDWFRESAWLTKQVQKKSDRT